MLYLYCTVKKVSSILLSPVDSVNPLIVQRFLKNLSTLLSSDKLLQNLFRVLETLRNLRITPD
jgi:hypothetical protein